MRKFTLLCILFVFCAMSARAQDVKMVDAIVNFFEYDGNTLQKSGYVGQIPQAMLAGGDLKLSFYGVIENVGATSTHPLLNVTVYNEATPTAIIYEEEIIDASAVAPGATTTLILTSSQAFTFPSDLPVGKYIVKFEAGIDDETDTDLTNNTKTCTFYITHNLYGRDAKLLNTSISPADFTGTATNGDGIAIYFDFYEEMIIEGFDFFVDGSTELGSSLTFVLQSLEVGEDPDDDAATYENLANQIYDIEDISMINAWNFISFTNPISITKNDPNLDYKRIRVLVTYNFNSKELALGADSSNTNSGQGVRYFTGSSYESGEAANPAVRVRVANDDRYVDPIAFSPDGYSKVEDLNTDIFVDYGINIGSYGTTDLLSQVSISPDPGGVEASLEGSKLYIDHNTLQEGTTYTVNIPGGAMSKDPVARMWSFTTESDAPQPSTDATLATLTVSEGTLSPAFSATVTAYTVSVANSVEEITITATANDANAEISGDTGTRTLTIGANTFTITVLAEDGETEEDYTIVVTRASVGIEERNADNVSLTIFPNPTSGKLQVTSPEVQIQQVDIFDISGKRLVTFNSSLLTQIDISNLANGIYLLKVKTAKGETIHKVVKQ